MCRVFHAYWIYTLIVGILTGCNEIVEPVIDYGDERFYPLQVGNEWIYQQTDIQYEISGFDTTTIQIKEEIVAADTLSSSTISFTIYKSIRAHENEAWTLDSVFQIRKDENYLLTQRGNHVVTTLNFPVVAGKRWDYNSHNTAAPQMVTYQEDTSSILNQLEVNIPQSKRILIILSNIPRNIVNQNEQYELYIKDVGLVEKKSIILEFCTVNCNSAGQINTGHYMLKQLISYEIQ